MELSAHGELTSKEVDVADLDSGRLAEAEAGEGAQRDLGAEARVGAVERRGLSVGKPAERPVLEADLEDMRADAEQQDEPVAQDLPESERIQSVGDPFATGTDGRAPVRSMSVFEHPDLLDEALRTAKRRLMIVAPWVKNAVVTTDFISRIEQRLRAKVDVTIAHGYGEDDRGSDDGALRRLENLAKRYEHFTFIRLRNTHTKILIFDDVWVSTSFNWLSFRGDADRTYRMEEGTMVSIPSRVQKQYEHYQAMLDETAALTQRAFVQAHASKSSWVVTRASSI
ncbi:hypothetical protein [Nocardioides sp. GXZ039]|uniref:hypothetical protein n=1 Tax=Nocardioides sp. GXZ039 TaxID=3136018 RepID=UPI0030F46B49